MKNSPRYPQPQPQFQDQPPELPLNLRRLTLEIFHLALPVAGQSLLRTLVFIVDRLMLGHYSVTALAAMQISDPLLWSIPAIIGAFSLGTLAYVGRLVGRGDLSLAGAAMRGSLALGAGVGLVAMVGLWWSLPPFLAWAMADDLGVQRAALAYLHVVILGLPALLVATVAAAGLQAAGDTRTPFVIGLGANTINISLNLILIFGWGLIPALGIRGAAIASLAATLFNAIFLCRELLRPQGRLNLRGWGQELPALGKILRISGPTFVEQVVEHLGYNCFVAMIIALGSTAMATHQVLLSLESVCFLSAEGFGVAGAAIVAQYLGAQQWRHATWGAWITTGLALVLLCIFGLTFLTLPRFLLALFTPDPDIIGVGIACLTIAAFAQPFMALGIVLGDTLRGAGDTRTALVVSLSGWLVVRSIMTYYFAFGLGLGLVGVWLGSTCDWIFRAGVLTMIFLGDRWRKVQF